MLRLLRRLVRHSTPSVGGSEAICKRLNANVLMTVYHINGFTFLLASRIQIKSLHKRNRAPPSLALVSPLNDEVYAPFRVSNESPLVDAFPHFRSSLYPQ